MFFSKKRKARKEAKKQMKLAEQAKSEAAVVEEPAPEQVKPVQEDPKPVAEVKPAAAKKPATKNIEEVDKSDKVAKYHISQNKKDGTPHFKEWRVRKEGSTKTIKFFKTQAEAIDYAKELADNQDSSIVIHKVDGTVRKQDYSKK